MTDKEILEEVWRKLQRMEHPIMVADWIQQEWQRADEEVPDMPTPHPNDCRFLDVKEIEKQNGLELDENGTTE